MGLKIILKMIVFIDSIFYFCTRKILKNDELPQNKYLYPSMLRNIEKTNLFKNLSSLEYNFKWAGNLYAYCPKFNLRYCLDKDKKGIIDIYLSLNFLQKSPFIPIATHLANFFNFCMFTGFPYKWTGIINLVLFVNFFFASSKSI